MTYGHMARKTSPASKGRSGRARASVPRIALRDLTPRALLRRALFWLTRAALAYAALILVLILLYTFINPPITLTMLSERREVGVLVHDWVDADEMAPAVLRAVVAAEDANFCEHWGFDMRAIRAAIDAGSNRGASTISQQVVKNVFLWQGRSWPRKALEAMITPVVELVWSKRRILEVYLNVAEFDTGIFGVEAAAKGYFGVSADKLTARQSALLAAVLPDPKGRDAAHPTAYLNRRAASITDGAATIRADGRAQCFGED
ncbi:monofunctional biosynthetic peptidoglycan transglycosylase [Phaeovulum sp. W22_SRMD_FR3]|uniref:monofunctional biosynthetic peptidoglycan transglycosylase n=1 Tax=Phaeovulum sp. W22_SRMD_FR3 TaxID=3240274 RepID=UPI003F96B59B